MNAKALEKEKKKKETNIESEPPSRLLHNTFESEFDAMPPNKV